MALPPTIHQGILNFPGATPESKAAAERLLEADRLKHHCFWGKSRFHNHLSHHILATYDLGASAKQLQAIYDAEKDGLDDINLAAVEEQHVNMTSNNWTEFLGEEKYYASFVHFFTATIAELGAGETLEQFVFSPKANGNGSNMLLRFVGGALHPLIQTGYALEFGSDAMLAQALAQTAVHSPPPPEVFDLRLQPIIVNGGDGVASTATSGHRQPRHGHSLFSILRETYSSPIMHPVMPYDPDALLSKRREDALKDGRRAQEIVRLCSLWVIDPSDIGSKVEELLWMATLLLASTGKPGRKPRLDFFLMHMLTASLFLPSLVDTIPTSQSKAAVLKAVLSVMLIYLLVRGRPRIDADLLMGYTSTPRPPNAKQDVAYTNPWPEILASVVHAPDAHTVKAIRSLYYAAQKYGTTPKGGAIGAFLPGTEEETLKGLSNVDGTIFVRAAGVVMDTLGWVTHGQQEGAWDRSALGWDDAWNDGR
ncbi:hypothetical protein BDY19DRAFT_894614 [Irpex rosettiformis]|uniref:Uncharacterized protein n=1 Tax=Irpex rosettiformis TaxID=378272 RepID=A0ACB8TX57_9APHY|nr:hypothetical protein BDY19DRAFT_894614 [Irpex rosettiformis]